MPKTTKRAEIQWRSVKQYDVPQFLPFHLPDGKVKDIEVISRIKPRGSRYPIVSMRNSIFMGMKPEILTFPEDIRLHYLTDKHGVLMSSIPQEVEQHVRQLSGAHGRVLIGGLGLGLAVAILEDNPAVQSVTVVEINARIIQLIKPHLPFKKTTIMYGDLNKYLDEWKDKEKFDFAYYDIWRGTSELDFSTEVWPLRRKSMGIVPQDKLECWNEGEMLGQIEVGCLGIISYRHTAEGKQFLKNLAPSDRKVMNARWAFLKYLQIVEPTDKHAFIALRSYLKALKDPELYDRVWDKYTTTNKQKNKP